MYYVETTNSPADDGSRGLELRHQEKIKKWFEGPPFLWRKEHILLRKCSIFEQVLDDDPEIKKVHKVNVVQVENGVLVRLQRLTWNWTRMKRLMALLIKIKDIWLKRIAKTASIIQLHDSIISFSYSGVNMFGPILIRERRSDLKRHATLFACFSSRAVHIEITNTIDPDSFIMALCRFLARRGSVQSIWSGNGTNFVGAINELKKALKEMDHLKIKKYLQGNGTDWI